nr:hypothetical protein [Cupriavidus gilardii]
MKTLAKTLMLIAFSAISAAGYAQSTDGTSREGLSVYGTLACCGDYPALTEIFGDDSVLQFGG